MHKHGLLDGKPTTVIRWQSVADLDHQLELTSELFTSTLPPQIGSSHAHPIKRLGLLTVPSEEENKAQHDQHYGELH